MIFHALGRMEVKIFFHYDRPEEIVKHVDWAESISHDMVRMRYHKDGSVIVHDYINVSNVKVIGWSDIGK